MANKLEFQIEQNWGDGCKAWEYISVNANTSDEDIKKLAVAAIKKDWKKQQEGPRLTTPEPCRPTIKICEVLDGKKVKNGIQLTAKWR